MTIHPSEIDRIVRGLTPTMRVALRHFLLMPFDGYPANLTKRSLTRLIEMGLLEEHRPDGGVGFLKWNLTPLGEAVRNALRGDGE